MNLAVYLEQVVRNFSRYYKYTLGSDLRQESHEVTTLIIRANSASALGNGLLVIASPQEVCVPVRWFL